MAEESTELRRIVWSEVFPFVRLFRTFRRAIGFRHMVLGLACVLSVYLTGRVLDAIWKAAGRGALVLGDSSAGLLWYRTEVQAYAWAPAGPRDAYANWLAMARQAQSPQRTGPFAALLDHLLNCAGNAAGAVWNGRWGLGSSPAEGSVPRVGALAGGRPALLSSLGAGGRGVLWLVTQRPGYALLFGAISLAALALFGGALCRSAVMQAAREEALPLGSALRFAREKFLSGYVSAPLIAIMLLVGTLAVVFVGGLFGAIPVVGEVLVGLLYGLALLAGFGAALLVLGLVLGFPLMWPTIAAEGSDSFDAMQRAMGYVGQRPWRAGLYALLLAVYGGACLLFVRCVALLLLKLAHLATGAGMSLFGLIHSARSEAHTKLDAMWRMPPWHELSFLPGTSGVHFWGSFGNAPLSGSESVGMYLLMVWVFLVVGLVAAFAVSFFFCGSTEAYLLLRRDLDAVDYNEVYCELPEPAQPASPAAPAGAESEKGPGTPLPVVSTPAPSPPPGDA